MPADNFESSADSANAVFKKSAASNNTIGKESRNAIA